MRDGGKLWFTFIGFPMSGIIYFIARVKIRIFQHTDSKKSNVQSIIFKKKSFKRIGKGEFRLPYKQGSMVFLSAGSDHPYLNIVEQ